MRIRHRLSTPWFPLAAGLLAAVAAWMACAPPAAAALVKPLTLTELTQKSKLIVTGEVTAMRSYRGPFQNAGEVIFTDVTIRITSTLKGEAAGSDVTVQVLGGQIGNTWQKCLESPRYTVGERVLVFLRDYNQATWNTGWLQGKYTLDAAGTRVTGAAELPIAREMSLPEVEASIRAVPPATLEPRTSTPGGAR